MKRILSTLIFLRCMIFPVTVYAQSSGITPPPPPVCASTNAGALYTNTSTSPATVYTCSYYNLAWQWVVNPSYGGLVYYPTVPSTCSGALPAFVAGYPDASMYVCVYGVPIPIGGAESSYINSLTTTGTSGAATVTSGVLNIPVYGGATEWSSLTNATGALTLNNTGYSSTFAQNSNDAWSLINNHSTDGGTNPQNSPSLNLGGTYYDGATDAPDVWTEQVLETLGVNPASYLNLSHAGSSGAAIVAVPGFVVSNGASVYGGIVLANSDLEMPIDVDATSSVNYSSKFLYLQSAFWNGSGSISDSWGAQNVIGVGATPTSTLTFTHSGSPGAATVSVPALTVNSGTHVMDRCSGGTNDGMYVAAGSTQATACTTGGGSLVNTGITTL